MQILKDYALDIGGTKRLNLIVDSIYPT